MSDKCKCKQPDCPSCMFPEPDSDQGSPESSYWAFKFSATFPKSHRMSGGSFDEGDFECAETEVPTCSLVSDVARFMAYANARGRFSDVADGPEKEAIIKLEGERNAEKWETSAATLLEMNGHLNSDARKAQPPTKNQ